MKNKLRAAVKFARGIVAGFAPTAAQFAGGGAATAGLYLLAGLGWTLLAAGLAVAAVSVLAESRGGH